MWCWAVCCCRRRIQSGFGIWCRCPSVPKTFVVPRTPGCCRRPGPGIECHRSAQATSAFCNSWWSSWRRFCSSRSCGRFLDVYGTRSLPERRRTSKPRALWHGNWVTHGEVLMAPFSFACLRLCGAHGLVPCTPLLTWFVRTNHELRLHQVRLFVSPIPPIYSYESCSLHSSEATQSFRCWKFFSSPARKCKTSWLWNVCTILGQKMFKNHVT